MANRYPDPLMIRDCHQQLRSIRRLLNAVIDDLGDCSANCEAGSDLGALFTRMQDTCTDFEAASHGFQETLAHLSRDPSATVRS